MHGPIVVRVWDAKTHEPKATLTVTGAVGSLAWHPDSRRLAVPGSSIWDALDGKPRADLADPAPFAWSPDGSEGISGSQFRAAATGQGLQSLSGRGQASAGPLSVSADGQRLIDTSARPGRLRDAATGAVLRDLLDLLPGSLTAWSPAGDRVAVWGVGGVPARLVDPETGALRAELKDALNITRLAWAPSGKHLATAVGSEITVWDATTGSPVHKLAGHTLAVVGLAWSPDGTRLASAALDNSIRMWDPLAGKSVETITQLPEQETFADIPLPLAWSADGQTLWVIRNNYTYPLDLRTGQFGPKESPHQNGSVAGAVVARDGKVVIKDGTDSAYLRTEDPVAKVRLGSGLGIGMLPVWLPDSRRILSPTGRGHVVFDTFTRSRLGTLFPIVGGEHWLVVGPTGHYQGSPGVESHIVYVAMHDDGSQRTYTPAAFAEKFGWKNDPAKATFGKLDTAMAAIAAPPFEGSWPRLVALRERGGKFWLADGTEVTSAAELPAGSALGKVAFQVPAGAPPLGDADADALRNLPVVEGSLRLEKARITDAPLARALGFAAFEKLTALEVVDTPAGDLAAAEAARLPALTRLVLTGTLVTDTGVQSLKVAKKLGALDLRRSKVTEAAVKALAAALPGCRIEWDGGAIEPAKR